MHMHTHIRVYTYMCIYAQIHMHMHVHAYAHTYIYKTHKNTKQETTVDKQKASKVKRNSLSKHYEIEHLQKNLPGWPSTAGWAWDLP